MAKKEHETPVVENIRPVAQGTESIETVDFDYELPTEELNEIGLSRTFYKAQFATQGRKYPAGHPLAGKEMYVPLRGFGVGVEEHQSKRQWAATSKSKGVFTALTFRATGRTIGVDIRDQKKIVEPGEDLIMVAVGGLKNIIPYFTDPDFAVEMLIQPVSKDVLPNGNNWWTMRFWTIGEPQRRNKIGAMTAQSLFGTVARRAALPEGGASATAGAAEPARTTGG